MQMRSQLRGLLLLLLAAFLWGTTFVAQSIGAGHVGAFTFLTVRSVIGVAVLAPVIRILKRTAANTGIPALDRKQLMIGGLATGFFLFAASAAQQIGIATTTAAKSSFITALYVVLVPVISILLGRRPPYWIWFCVALSVAGLYFLCIKAGDGFVIATGDLWTLLAGALFAGQILCVGHFAPLLGGVRLTCMSFVFETLFAALCIPFFEQGTTAAEFYAAFPAMLYAGLFSSGVAYTLQAVAEKEVSPPVASLAMCMESVFGALSGWIILHESLSLREITGCLLMLLSILLAQLPSNSVPNGVSVKKEVIQ